MLFLFNYWIWLLWISVEQLHCCVINQHEVTRDCLLEDIKRCLSGYFQLLYYFCFLNCVFRKFNKKNNKNLCSPACVRCTFKRKDLFPWLLSFLKRLSWRKLESNYLPSALGFCYPNCLDSIRSTWASLP